ncbi:3-methyladenine DNA glycosylase [Brachybacterium saurashtrense]|uniref:3-methyladenine DNA glycosylase n=1 Tax=Brachybacterium saurashtrense TaxID=556288 RepID=A0A345YN42_9MICO|nr:3-methyladenine DNA glycosylase [Brachybacterium saurashtrense]AXK45344.1 3-methyladenine DNA glycosylase [Brachybacterium saurashtrense]RRR21899.1 3-methyladenine DNA glycosylase [Brachybacterium saurashtrense]
MPAPPPVRTLSAAEAVAARHAHEQRADALTAAHRARKRRGEKHAVEDFLFTYYPFSAARLRRWHPGWRVDYTAAADVDSEGRPLIADVDEAGHRSWYLDSPGPEAVRRADVQRYLAERADALAFMTRLLRSSALTRRRPEFGCFGLHEWAMVHGLGEGEQRHEDLPLRLTQQETDAVVERENLVCSHIDAFRFFTPSAAPRNSLEPARATQVDHDNPACLHVGMDLYKWSMKLTPLIPSDLVLDCFEHARTTRVLDMEASPYDVRPLGYGAVPIETPAGKAEYVRRQRELARGAEALRQRLLEELEGLHAGGPVP